jgi:glycerate 2-kinase
MLNHDKSIAIFNAALEAVDPYRAVLQVVSVNQHELRVADAVYDLNLFNKIKTIGAGKAAAPMALALEQVLGERIAAGLVIVKDGHTATLKHIQQIEASHPLPNQAGVDGTQKILGMVQGADERTLIICVLSGGASALLVAPAAGISLADKQQLTQLLLQAGANINELNAVRKHLSAVKGGRLAQAAFPAQMVTLILSDVVGDPLDVIASGPTTFDRSTFADAWKVLEKYCLLEKIPSAVLQHLQQGLNGTISETVKPGDTCLHKVQHVIVGNNVLALQAAKQRALLLGYESKIIRTDMQGEARIAAQELAQLARVELDNMHAGERRCLLSGGETTVTVDGQGMGGRNQELALAFALVIDGLDGVTLLSVGTDGSDGANDAAGAWVSGDTVAQARRAGVDPLRYLQDNDSYHFFKQFDAATGRQTHLLTGPTGTNVMDVQIMLLER